MHQRKKKGVTLIELLLVVVILGVLAAIAIPKITASSTTAKLNACKTNIDILNSQIEMYRVDTGDYPATLATLTSDPNYFPEDVPVCPSNGTYTMNGTTYRCSCDAAGH